jgi:hypothetical protein
MRNGKDPDLEPDWEAQKHADLDPDPQHCSGLFGTDPDTRIRSEDPDLTVPWIMNGFSSVLRIRDVYTGSEFLHPGFRVKRFRIRIKEFKYLNPKNC